MLVTARKLSGVFLDRSKQGRPFTTFIQNYHVLSAPAEVMANERFSETLPLDVAIPLSDVDLVQITPEPL